MQIGQFQSRREAELALRRLAAESGWVYVAGEDAYRAVNGHILSIAKSEFRKGWWAIVSQNPAPAEHSP